jgi:hypothetical protein
MRALRYRELALPFALFFILLATTVLLLAVVELCARLINPTSIVRPIFPAYSRVNYSTREFSIVAVANQFGFRGDEAEVAPGQIATIGDSFTFGWGSNVQDTWQYKLERRLSSTASPMKVYNLGRPGADPDDYLDTARSYVPFLKPKIVIVSLLQGDDLAQLLEKHRRQGVGNLLSSARSLAKDHLYGVLSIVRGRSGSAQTMSATESWSEFAREVIQRKHLHLPPDLEEWAVSGNLNPGLLSSAAEFPRQLVAPYETANVGALRIEISSILQEISMMTKKAGGTVILFSMPNSPYFRTRFRDTFQRLGFEVPNLNYCEMEHLVAGVSHDLGIRYIAPTKKLRENSSLDELWYPFDGHPTGKGNEVIAEFVFEALTHPDAGSHDDVCQ